MLLLDIWCDGGFLFWCNCVLYRMKCVVCEMCEMFMVVVCVFVVVVDVEWSGMLRVWCDVYVWCVCVMRWRNCVWMLMLMIDVMNDGWWMCWCIWWWCIVNELIVIDVFVDWCGWWCICSDECGERVGVESNGGIRRRRASRRRRRRECVGGVMMMMCVKWYEFLCVKWCLMCCKWFEIDDFMVWMLMTYLI